MQKIALGARILLGTIFTIFGLNGLLMTINGHGFIPMPPPPAEMMTIMNGLMATKYLMPLVFLCQFLSGVFFLSGFFVNAALVIIGPIIVNILGIHLAVEPSGLPMAIVVTVLYLLVLGQRWQYFKDLLKMK